ncbi:transglutaminase-like domain-containing protein [Ureibacillus aquaedulcis]|uniref:Transglutaminase-like domain-containing protein n=1 Tax=Ureibacillus aquaedulcis TaxID=3058421 RepID=A0ABT8GU67_9BACL|nr:transglutaminase-like domain-containing protein [Ureibacillus sp. BA0131]MDN4494932.1 transglutaminase-like domain-containing protein [Ureibacillus sp. BA0131]
MIKNSFSLIELLIYYIVIFFILREWLVPIMDLTKTGYMELILLFIALSLVISLFRIHFIASWLVKVAYILWFIVFIYDGVFVLSAEGIDFLFSDFQTNIEALMRADWPHITDPFRTFLFFILIWMLIYLIHHWIVVRMNIFYFLLLTVFFVGALDTFTEYDGSLAIVRIMLLGLIMTVSLLIKRLINNANIKMDLMKYLKLVVPVILLVVAVSSIAFFLPKSPPQWPDPVPFIKSAAGKGGSEVDEGGIKKVGYGDNDSRLGGSFVADDTVVFLAEASTKQYWRVETKDVYTSKGWEDAGYSQGELRAIAPGETIDYSLPRGPEEDTKTATIQVMDPYDFVIQPYGLKNVTSAMMSVHPNLEFMMSLDTEKIMSYVDRAPTALTGYTVEYSKPVFQYSALKDPTEEIDPMIGERYLQLPEALPDRVKDLATDIVEGRETPYDKARAIEMYFKQNGFRYDTDNIAIPSEEQDYVDQFLFETKIGYCDNFSTSMVVLLRSVGIPARWVKGFAGGDLVDNNGSMSTYQITNNDAHSWVEAYIPSVGWVNFEPTIGFNSSRSIDYDLETDAYQEDALTIEEETEPDEVVEEEPETQQTTPQENRLSKNISDFFEQNKFIFMLLLAAGIVCVFVLYKIRRKWLPKVYAALYRRKDFNESTFEAAFLQLLKLLELKGFKRKDGQTLQTFAKEMDAYFETGHMSRLTKFYEQSIYSKNASKADMSQMKESWEYLINQITS